MEETIYGHTHTSLTGAFLTYVDKDEREVIERALNDFQAIDTDELVSVLDSYDCRKLLTKDNIHVVIEEIAHKQLIQTPMFVIDCWRTVIGQMAFHSHASFMALYDSLIPNTKAVKKNLVFPEQIEDNEKQSKRFLNKFVAGLDDRLLKRFLRFCSGSDLFLGHPLKINFSRLTGLERRPMGHTCTYELDIPVDYDSYPEFRDEFSSILNSNEWEMDNP
jgi:hypothetical protein